MTSNSPLGLFESSSPSVDNDVVPGLSSVFGSDELLFLDDVEQTIELDHGIASISSSYSPVGANGLSLNAMELMPRPLSPPKDTPHSFELNASNIMPEDFDVETLQCLSNDSSSNDVPVMASIVISPDDCQPRSTSKKQRVPLSKRAKQPRATNVQRRGRQTKDNQVYVVKAQDQTICEEPEQASFGQFVSAKSKKSKRDEQRSRKPETFSPQTMAVATSSPHKSLANTDGAADTSDTIDQLVEQQERIVNSLSTSQLLAVANAYNHVRMSNDFDAGCTTWLRNNPTVSDFEIRAVRALFNPKRWSHAKGIVSRIVAVVKEWSDLQQHQQTRQMHIQMQQQPSSQYQKQHQQHQVNRHAPNPQQRATRTQEQPRKRHRMSQQQSPMHQQLHGALKHSVDACLLAAPYESNGGSDFLSALKRQRVPNNADDLNQMLNMDL